MVMKLTLSPNLTIYARAIAKLTSAPSRSSSSSASANSVTKSSKNTDSASESSLDNTRPKEQSQQKTVAELDEALRKKLEGISGDGGEAGLEFENGKPVSMKRGVRDNMFRYI